MKVILQVLVFGLLLAAAQVGVHRLFPNPPAASLLREMWGTFKAKVVFLGDSVNRASDREDRDRSAVSDMLERKLETRVATVSRGGLTLAVFSDFGRYLARHAEAPKTLFVTVNLAVLSGDSRSPYTTHKEIGFEMRRADDPVRDVFMRPMHIFRFPEVRPDIRMEEYLKQEIYWDGKLLGRMADLEYTHPRFARVTDRSVKEHLIVRYLRPLQPRNVLLAAMEDLAERMREKGFRAVFFIAPVNHEVGERHFPGRFRPAIAAKAEAVKAVGDRTRTEVLDLSFLLGDEFFAREKYPNEHLNQRGRDALAQRLADLHHGRIKADTPR